MMGLKKKTSGMTVRTGNSRSSDGEAGSEWEVRPGGMLVQKRTSESDQISVPPPIIRVRVKHGSIYHQVNISSQATFGELKKLLSGMTGLHHEDEKLIYKDKERDSKAFLDISGVKDKSKIVLVEDPVSQEKRLIEQRKIAKMEKAAKSISEISLEVDRFAGQVSALELVINKGGRVAEADLVNLIEQLMNQVLKLDGIMADGDVKLQRKMQVTRIQKHVETLDMLKVKNSLPNGQKAQPSVHSQRKNHKGKSLPPIQEEQLKHQHQHQQRPKDSTSGVVVTTNWETFDSASPLVPSTSASTATSVSNNPVHPKFNWDDIFN